jgi:hypothetical protein
VIHHLLEWLDRRRTADIPNRIDILRRIKAIMVDETVEV